VVIAEQATEPFTTLDRFAEVRGRRIGEGDGVREPLVVSLGVEMLDVVLSENSAAAIQAASRR
jgi:hypothetical protein